MTPSRDVWQAELSGLGFVPWAASTKNVKLVVAADPDSLSGKARKALDYGSATVDERGLKALIDAGQAASAPAGLLMRAMSSAPQL